MLLLGMEGEAPRHLCILAQPFESTSSRTNTGRVGQLPGNKHFALADDRRPRRQRSPKGHNDSVLCRRILIHIEGQDGLTAVITDSDQRSQLIFILTDNNI